MEMLFEILKIVFVGFMAFMWHEAGHYIAYRSYGMKPSIQWKGLCLMIGENCIGQLKGYQAVFVSMMGIIAGLMLLAMVSGTILASDFSLLVLLYVAGCYFDMMVISKGLEQWNENFRG